LEPNPQRNLRLTLAGLQAGCLGSLVMIAWWMVAEILQRRSPWLVPNLLATTFYGERVYRPGFMISTWSGVALPMVIYCLAAIAFALAARERKAGWLFVAACGAWGLTLNWLVFGFVLRRTNPLIHIYSPDRVLAVSHLLYGLALATYPNFAKGLLGRPAPARASVPPPLPDLDEQIRRSVPESADQTTTGPRPLQ
jgi:hypothetical protein